MVQLDLVIVHNMSVGGIDHFQPLKRQDTTLNYYITNANLQETQNFDSTLNCDVSCLNLDE